MSDFKENITGRVFDIQRYSIHDGPGIRTVVFLKGCPLRCLWCANPESQRFEPEITYQMSNCAGCRQCESVCPQRGCHLEASGLRIDRSRCLGCGACANACIFHALKLEGASMRVSDVLEAVKKDMPFYKKSGGGVTLSGGEAFAQPEFTLSLLSELRAARIHTAVETSGFTSYNMLQKADVDLFLFDLKHIDDRQHRKFTGVSNQKILDNLERLICDGRQVIVRMPMIPDVNMTPDTLHATGAYLHRIGAADVHLLPYHRLGLSKYQLLGREYAMEATRPPAETTMEEAFSILKSYGLHVGHS